MDGFNWNDLRFLVALARAGNPATAARQLRVDHNTVRRRVGALEADLGARLFEKREDRYTLTNEGERLLRSAEQIEGIVASAHADLLGSDMALSGTVRVGAPNGLGAYFLAQRFVKFRALHAHLNVELAITSRDFNLSKREADIAVIIGRPTEGRTVIKKLCDVVLRLYGSRSYLAEHPPITAVTDLARHDVVGGIEEFDFGPVITQLSSDGQPFFVPWLASTSVISQLRAVQAGGGLGFFANFVVENAADLVPVLPDEASFSREIWLATHADLKDLARVKAVSSFIAREFAAARHSFD